MRLAFDSPDFSGDGASVDDGADTDGVLLVGEKKHSELSLNLAWAVYPNEVNIGIIYDIEI